MNEAIPDNSPATEAALGGLRELRRALLYLHKTLLDIERADYEQLHGSVSSGEMLRLVISHEQFAWLRSLSGLIVRIDEMLSVDEPATVEDVESLLAETRALLTPSETGDDFARKYFDALQREPDVVLAHREVKKLL